jgi:hypothetical protein
VSNNLQIVSIDGATITVKADTGVNSGFASINASYNNGSQATKNIPIYGEPRAYTIESNGDRYYMGGGYFFFQSYGATGSFSVFSDTPNTSFTWTGPSNLNWWNTNNNTVEFYLNQTGDYIFNATANNGCSSRPYFVSVKIAKSGGPDPMFRVAPNPVETNTLIIKDISSNSKEFSSTNDTQRFSDDVTLTLYDFNSNIIMTKTLRRGYSGKEYKLDVSKFKNQNYFVRIVSGEIDEVYQIILNK